MDRRRLFQGVLTLALVAFLAVLAFQFRPKVASPRPVTLPGSGAGVRGTLTTTGFRYVQEQAGKTAFVLTAEKVTERSGESRDLLAPRLTMPGAGGEAVLSGAQGLFDPTTRTLRIFGDAKLVRPDGWTALAPGFRLTPEGEFVAEEAVALSRGTLRGTADLMRYDREAERAHLEGHVRFADAAGRSATCSRLQLDLAAHTGALAGPVTLESPQGRVVAPEGQILLGPDNTVQEVRLGSPATGEGPAGRFRADRLVLSAGAGGDLERLALEGAVRAEAAPSGEVFETARVVLSPTARGGWNWSSPGALSVAKGGDRLEAPSGSGSAGEGPFSALLPGPVRGDGPSGRWSARRASVQGPARALEGEVEGARPGETLKADRVVLGTDGAREATGHVRGTREPRGAPPLKFEADRAVVAPADYPILLQGAVRVERGAATLTAPAATVRGPRVAEATGGATVRFEQPKEAQTLRAKTVVYDGDAARVTATGEARGEGRGYTLTADAVRASLDPAGEPTRYEASGAAHLDGAEHEASGDRLTWEPARRAGTAESDDGRAVVVQKNPYRRAEGPRVAFEGEAVTVSGATPGRRGFLESAPPAPRRPDGR